MSPARCSDRSGHHSAFRPLPKPVRLLTRPAIALGGALLAAAMFPADRASAQVVLLDEQLAFCSSMRTEHCRGQPDWSEQALTEVRYRIEPERVLRWALAQQLAMESRELSQWTEHLLSLAGDDPVNLSREEFITVLQQGRRSGDHADQAPAEFGQGDSQNNGVDQAVLDGLLDFFQIEQPDHKEQVALDQSIDREAVSVLNDFVERAARVSERERPLIAVMTAAARDPYTDLAYYRQLFEQAGADVVWLPLDAAVRRARSDRNCLDLPRYQALELGVHDRQRHAPERFREQMIFCLDRNAGMERVATIDALFLNDGDLGRLLNAFHDAAGNSTAELEILRRRLSDRRVVLGGSGAGAVAQAAGNFSVVPFGLIATNFSAGQGQISMAWRLVGDQHRYGLGIDAGSALIVDRLPEGPGYRLQARGRHGVWLLDQGPEPIDGAVEVPSTAVALRRLAAGRSMDFDPTVGLVAEAPVVPDYAFEDCQAMDKSISFNDFEDLEATPPGALLSCYRQTPADGVYVDWLLEPAEITASQASNGLLVVRTASVVAPAAPD